MLFMFACVSSYIRPELIIEMHFDINVFAGHLSVL